MNRKQRRLLTRRHNISNSQLLKGVEPIQEDSDMFCRLHFPLTPATPKKKLDSVRFQPFYKERFGKKYCVGLMCPLCKQVVKPPVRPNLIINKNIL